MRTAAGADPRDLRPTRSGWADLFGPLAVGSVVVVVGLWALQHGFRSGSLGATLESLGLLTGLVAADLLLIQVLLLARIPWVERAWGHDVLTRRHRWVGFVSFWLMLAHVAAFGVQRLVRDDSASWGPLLPLFVTGSWMLWASAGTVALVAVTLTSVRAARRRLRYESWHLLHLYAYLGVGLALPHQIFAGVDFQAPLTRAYWWTLWALAAAAVLVFRVALPLWRSWQYGLRVASAVVEPGGGAASVVSVTVAGRGLDRLRARSGQFFVWRFRDGPGWTRGHPYTLSAAPQPDRLRMTVRAAGDDGDRLARLPPGTPVLVEGPYGTMTAQWRRHPRLLLMAAGVGITPIRALLEDTPYAAGEAVLVYRCSDLEHAVLLAEVTEIARRRGAELHLLLGPRRADGDWRPAGGDVGALTTLVPDVAGCDVYVCGPPPWVAAIRRAARQAGARRDQLHTESFVW